MRASVLALVLVAASGCVARTGSPYVWACTPANYYSGGNTPGTVMVYNGSASLANVSVKLLNRNGTNLAGTQVPGAPPGPVYPGQTGTTTVPLEADRTMVVSWTTAQGNPATDTTVPTTVRVSSDQPIVVGSNIEFSGFHPTVCGFMHP